MISAYQTSEDRAEALNEICRQERMNMNDELSQNKRTGGDAQTKSVPSDCAGGEMEPKEPIGDRTGGDAQTKGIEDFHTQ